MRLRILESLGNGGPSRKGTKCGVYSRIHKHETLPMSHSALNAKFHQIFIVKMGHLCCRILIAKTWWEYCFVCYDTLEVKRCRIFATQIRWNATGFLSWKFSNDSKTCYQSIDCGHILSKIKPQSPIHLKPQKLMPITHF